MFAFLTPKSMPKLSSQAWTAKKIRKDGQRHKSRRFGRKKSVDKAAKERDSMHRYSLRYLPKTIPSLRLASRYSASTKGL
jgi:hypothetical protein